MTRRWLLWGLLLVPLLMGGQTNYLGSQFTHRYAGPIDDLIITPNTQYKSPCNSGPRLFNGDDPKASCFVPSGYTLTIESFTVWAVEPLTAIAAEQTELVLETNSTGSATTGTEIATSSIQIGELNPNAAGNCINGAGAAVTIDSRGESCTRIIDTTDANAWVTGGGWWRVKAADPAVGTSGSIESVRYQVLATLRTGG